MEKKFLRRLLKHVAFESFLNGANYSMDVSSSDTMKPDVGGEARKNLSTLLKGHRVKDLIKDLEASR